MYVPTLPQARKMNWPPAFRCLTNVQNFVYFEFPAIFPVQQDVSFGIVFSSYLDEELEFITFVHGEPILTEHLFVFNIEQMFCDVKR
jgi:hypothetical protein